MPLSIGSRLRPLRRRRPHGRAVELSLGRFDLPTTFWAARLGLVGPAALGFWTLGIGPIVANLFPRVLAARHLPADLVDRHCRQPVTGSPPPTCPSLCPPLGRSDTARPSLYCFWHASSCTYGAGVPATPPAEASVMPVVAVATMVLFDDAEALALSATVVLLLDPRIRAS